MTKRKKAKRTKRPPIKIICAFGYVTKERVEALPEAVKDRLGKVVYDCLMSIAEREECAVKMAA